MGSSSAAGSALPLAQRPKKEAPLGPRVAAEIRRGSGPPTPDQPPPGAASERLEGDGLSEWHQAFLQLAPTLEGCARRYAHNCQRYRPRAKPARKSHWGSRLLQRDRGSSSKGAGRKWVAAGLQVLPWGGGPELPLPLQWQQLAEMFRRANGARASDWEAKLLL